MNFIDTHCHIHESDYPLDPIETLDRARRVGVTRLVCVGTTEQSSQQAVEFAGKHDGVFAAVGVHPHDVKDGWGEIGELLEDASGQDGEVTATPAQKIVAIGEIGLDYFYMHSPREVQIEALEAQINLALTYNLPIIFHVREAFDDFWPIIDNSHGIRGELHSFTDTTAHLEEGLKRGFFIGINGISTFTKDTAQKAMFAQLPLDRMLLETDAPFLTPVPFRGKVNEPAFVWNIAEQIALDRGISIEEVAAATAANARALFALR